MTSFLRIKECVFFENDKTNLRHFFKILKKTLVCYNMHKKALHSAFRPDLYLAYTHRRKVE